MARPMGTVLFGLDLILAVKLTLSGDPTVKIDPRHPTSTAGAHSLHPARQHKLTAAGLIHNKSARSARQLPIEAGPNPCR